jgi:regulator of sigma E protease
MFDTLQALQAAFGIGLVIFVHEAGHFLAARWCGVRVLVFSLGFGPPLLRVVRKGTAYQLGVVPIGGFVTMAGEHGEGRDKNARDGLLDKTTGQRFLIYSGGVIMNVALAVVVFPLLFWIGVPFLRPVVSEVLPGGPAWQAGIRTGTEILAVDGSSVFDGIHVTTEVALGDREGIELTVRDPGAAQPRTVQVVPEYDRTNGMNRIGLQLRPPEPNLRLEVGEDTPAHRAGLRSGDRVLGVPGLPPEWPVLDQLRTSFDRGEVLPLRVETVAGEVRELELRPSLEPSADEATGQGRLGILPGRCAVVALRPSPLVSALDLAVGDRLIAVDGQRILRSGDLVLALLGAAPGAEWIVDRPQTAPDGSELPPRRLHRQLPALDREAMVDAEAVIALELDLEDLHLAVTPGEGGALGGLRDGDRLLAIDGLADPEWSTVHEQVKAAAAEGRAVALTVERQDLAAGAAREVLALEPRPLAQPARERTAPYNEYGFALPTWSYTYRASSPIEALRVGLSTSWLYVEQTWLTLRGMLLAQVSTKNIGGPVAIGQISYTFADEGWVKLFFFLCMLSVNLALLNVLPIPVLDGGHLLFLIVEKLKGSPVSERVVAYSQLVGVVFIVGLFVYVTYNDIARVLSL